MLIDSFCYRGKEKRREEEREIERRIKKEGRRETGRKSLKERENLGRVPLKWSVISVSPE